MAWALRFSLREWGGEISQNEFLGLAVCRPAQYNVFMETGICTRLRRRLCRRLALSACCLLFQGIVWGQEPPDSGDREAQFTHTVKVNRQGRTLILRYVLLDPAGQEQDLREMTQEPPRFTVYQGEKKLATGQFEFG